LTVIVVALLLGIVNLSLSASNAQPSKTTGGTFIVGTVESELVTNMNPLTASGLSGDILSITYADSLIYLFNNGTYIPWLAQSWKINNDGKTIIFNLVHNAYWMNGTSRAMPLTSQDVAFTFEVLRANTTLDVNGVDPFISNISTPNNYTIIFNLTKPNIMMFGYIGGQVIIPYAWHNYYSNISRIGNFTNMNIGHQLQCGPMLLTSISNSEVKLVANPYFFKGKPNFNSEIIELFESNSSEIEALETGEIYGTYVDPNSAYSALSTYPGVRTVAFKDPFNLNLWFNDNVSPYNNTDFRIGLAYAINKTQILQKPEEGLGGKANMGGLPWTLSNYYNNSVPYYSYSYNISTANKYFTMAGLHIGSSGYWEYKNGTIVKINMIDLNLADWDAAMTLIQDSLFSDHFQANFEVVPTGVWVNDIFGIYNFTVMSFFNFGPLLGNPWYDLWAEYDSVGYWNFEHYNNPLVNSLLNQSEMDVLNPAAFNATIKEIQGITASQMPVILVMGAKVYYAYLVGKVGGFYPDQQLLSPLDSLYGYSVTNKTSNTIGVNMESVYAIIIIIVIIIAASVLVVKIRHKNK